MTGPVEYGNSERHPRGGGPLASLAESRGLPLAVVIAAADADRLAAIIARPLTRDAERRHRRHQAEQRDYVTSGAEARRITERAYRSPS